MTWGARMCVRAAGAPGADGGLARRSAGVVGLGLALTLSLAPVHAAWAAPSTPATVPTTASPGAATRPAAPTLRDLPSPYTANIDSLLPPARGPDADIAYGAYQRGRYRTAFREATKRIEANPRDAAAQTLLGELYNQGLGVRQDPARARQWYGLAAAQGDVHAMASLGLMSLDGRGGQKDAKAGRRWLEQGAAKGEPSAAYNLALILLGTGRDEDAAEAATRFRIAAQAELAPAQHDLGVLYLQGRGVPKDETKAAELFRRAADNGDLGGEVEFAILLFNGRGAPRDEARAARYFLHAAQRGNAIAQNRIARLYVVGRGVPKNRVEAAAWNLAASAQGLSDGWLDQSLGDLSAEERGRAEAFATQRASIQP